MKYIYIFKRNNNIKIQNLLYISISIITIKVNIYIKKNIWNFLKIWLDLISIIVYIKVLF